MKKKSAILLSALLAIGIAGTAAAQSAEDAIEYRQSVFQTVKWNMGPMTAMAKGEKPFDKDAFLKHATRVEQLSHMPLEGFTPDSDLGETDAKPEVWSKRAEFEKRMKNWQEQAAKLAQVAKAGDERAIKAQFGELGKSCKACHDDFRVKR
ncbi:MAG: cytochrome c [Chromatiales bacterium]|jgi:cytochrome c556|nr:cytochrome c [Chromatiales bacterium]MDX9767348.1 cytochrome c [Ectothiorhodospiraceae bacterium]